jgi:hypothetical protein
MPRVPGYGWWWGGHCLVWTVTWWPPYRPDVSTCRSLYQHPPSFPPWLCTLFQWLTSRKQSNNKLPLLSVTKNCFSTKNLNALLHEPKWGSGDFNAGPHVLVLGGGEKVQIQQVKYAHQTFLLPTPFFAGGVHSHCISSYYELIESHNYAWFISIPKNRMISKYWHTFNWHCSKIRQDFASKVGLHLLLLITEFSNFFFNNEI